MYEKFFYLNENPFHITPDPRYLYLSRKHTQAIELMSYGITGRKGFVLLTGEVGTGKTTLCRALLGKLPGGIESALILNPVLSGRELIQTITQDFGIRVAGDSVKDHLGALNDFLLKVSARGGNAVIIIDEAQNLSPEAMEMLRLLSNLETDREKLLQIIMVGQPELRAKLGMAQLRQINQRIMVRHCLDPLDEDDTRGYIDNRLRVAGTETDLRFSSEAVHKVFDASQGIPRMINIICDRTLTAAFVEEKRVIAGDTVEKALEELAEEGYLAATFHKVAAGTDLAHGDYVQFNLPGIELPGQAVPPSSAAYRRLAPPDVLRAGVGGQPFYSRYLPYIALSTFVLALAAGFIGATAILNDTAVTGLFP